MNLFLFDFTKTKTGAKTAPQAPKLSYFDGRPPILVPRLPTERRRDRPYEPYFRTVRPDSTPFPNADSVTKMNTPSKYYHTYKRINK